MVDQKTPESSKETKEQKINNTETSQPQNIKASSDSQIKNNQPATSLNPQEDEKLFGTIAYASIACLLTLTLKPKSEYCQFHGKQGLILFGLSVIILIILAIFPQLGLLLFFGYFALIVIAMYRAYNGEMWEMPIIGALTKKIDMNKLTMPELGNKEQDTKQSQADQQTDQTTQTPQEEEKK